MPILASLIAFAALSATGAPYLDPSLAPADRAKNLVSQMTDDEKIAQCMMDAPAIPRLGVPAYHYWSEALHGIANEGYATVFPQAIGLSSTWDPTLMHQVSTTISIEARAKYVAAQGTNQPRIFHGITLWSPNVNIFRDPRWGRGQETYGEDPFLTSRMGVAFVTGIQGDDPVYLRAVSTPKHFAVHSGPEPLRHGFDAKVTERELRETYLPAFEACIKEGKAASTMAAYSGFNGVPVTGSHWLLTDLLRGEWGFNGAVVSDVDSVGDLLYGHHVVNDVAEASAMALKAGDDEDSGTTYKGLKDALTRGLITEADLDQATTRIFTLRMRLAMFNKPEDNPYSNIVPADNDTPDHERLALKAAQESMVLLKNDGILPLDTTKYKHVAIIGPVATSLRVLVGNYNGTPARPVTLLDGIQQKLEARGVKVDYLQGCRMVDIGSGINSLPRGVLYNDATLATGGLAGQVYDNPNLDGTPTATRNDRRLDFHWSIDQPAQGIPTQNTSIRWQGVMVWPNDEAVNLGVTARGGVRLYIADKLVVDKWDQAKGQPEATYHTVVNFKKGQPVNVKIEYSQAADPAVIRFGYSDLPGFKYDYTQAEDLAKSADLTILTLGISPDLEGEQMPVNIPGFLGGDRTSLDLPKPQAELLSHVAAIGKPVVLVLTTGSAISLDTKKVNALLVQWYSGEKGGEAVADTLVGESNPAGRLPVTFYRSVADLPAFDDYHMTGRTYRYFKGHTLYPFGYGLSYSKFNYGKAELASTTNGYTVTVPVKNVSNIAGDEVVEVYARFDKPQQDDPIRKLVGFKRVSLQAGEQQDVPVDVTNWALRSWNDQTHAYEVRPGGYTLEIGPSSNHASAKVKLKI